MQSLSLHRNTTKWVTTRTARGVGNYELRMQNDGNLVIYDKAVARGLRRLFCCFGHQWIHKVGAASGASLYTVDGDAFFGIHRHLNGRSGAFGYELVGSSPAKSDKSRGLRQRTKALSAIDQ